MPSAARRRTAARTAKRCLIDSWMIRSSMFWRPLVIVARARLLDVGLDHVAVLGCVDRSRIDPANDLGPFRALLAQLQHTNFVSFADLREDHAEIAELLDRVGAHRQWNRPLIDRQKYAHRHARTPVPVPVGRSEEHTSELQSLMRNTYAVFCLKKK